jgi:hypothetical protein
MIIPPIADIHNITRAYKGGRYLEDGVEWSVSVGSLNPFLTASAKINGVKIEIAPYLVQPVKVGGARIEARYEHIGMIFGRERRGFDTASIDDPSLRRIVESGFTAIMQAGDARHEENLAARLEAAAKEKARADAAREKEQARAAAAVEKMLGR